MTSNKTETLNYRGICRSETMAMDLKTALFKASFAD